MSVSLTPTRSVIRLPLSAIHSNPFRPRGCIPEDSIEQLAQSIRLHGLLSPLLARSVGNGCYELISGERRLRALRLLNREWAEVVVLSGDACDLALIALVENLQRQQLHFLDVAAACRRILDSHPITQERLAAGLSCSPSALANRLRLLKLPESVQDVVRAGGLSERHARALLRLTDEGSQLALAALAAERQLSVLQLEKRVEERLSSPAPKKPEMKAVLRDNSVVINALMDTVRRLTRIGVPVKSRVEAGEDCVNVIVTIPTGKREGITSA